MAEQIVIQEQTQTPEQKPQEQKPEVDLVTRVSQIKPKEQVKQEETETKFNINELDSKIETIQDPALKEQFVNFKKSLLRGENQKYQEIATLRKEYEKKIAEVTSWTPERLQQEINKPDFVQAAQVVLKSKNPPNSGISDEQYSALSEAERTELSQLKNKINILEQTNYESFKAQQDVQLKGRYANYNPQAIDTLTADMLAGKVQATREHLHKVLDYDDAIKRAYEMGLMDRNSQNQEKANAMSFVGTGNMTPSNTIERQKGESVQEFMKRSYNEHSKKK